MYTIDFTVLHTVHLFFTAMPSFDYINVSSNEVFEYGTSDGATRCVNIAIIDDELLEGNQTFTVTLTSLDSDVVLRDNMTTITITDNESQ